MINNWVWWFWGITENSVLSVEIIDSVEMRGLNKNRMPIDKMVFITNAKYLHYITYFRFRGNYLYAFSENTR